MKNFQVSETTNGIVIAVLVFLLCISCIGLFWEAQVITRQEAVIRMLGGSHE